MTERLTLTQYVPESQRDQQVEVRDELAPVVERIAQLLPPDKIWEYYHSEAAETRGKITFPYCRVDSLLNASRINIYLLNNKKRNTDQSLENYQKASIYTLRALIWVEVGFQGLENLAVSTASRNWTGAVGQPVDDEGRARGILTGGAKYYRDSVQEFVDLRRRNGITEDCFTLYKAENLLKPYTT